MSNLADLLPAGGGQNNTDFVADGAISSGAPVVLTAAGKAAAVIETAEAIGTETEFASVRTDYSEAVYDVNANRIVIFYNSNNAGPYAVVGTVSGSSISFGTPVATGQGQIYGAIGAVYDSTNNKVLYGYRTGTSSGLKVVVGTVDPSDNSITFGTAGAVDDGSNENGASMAYDANAQRVVVSFRDANNSQYGAAAVGTVSGTSISFGTPVLYTSFALSSTGTSTVYDPVSQKVLLGYRNTSGTLRGYGIVGTVSGTTISFGTAVIFSGSIIPEGMKLGYSSSANKILIVYEDSSTNNGHAVTATISGTSVSYGADLTWVSNGLVADQDSKMALNDDTNANLMVLGFNNTSYQGQVVNFTISGDTVTASSITTWASGTTTYYIGGAYHTVENKSVFSWGKASTTGEAITYSPESTNLTSTNLLGIASGAISDTATGTINTWGSRNEAAFAALATGSTTNLTGKTQSPYPDITYDITQDKFVVFFEDANISNYGTAVVVTVSGSTVSFGTPVVFNSGTTIALGATYSQANGRHVVVYPNYSDSQKATAAVGTVSGTSISFGTPVVFDSTATNTQCSVAYNSTLGKYLAGAMTTTIKVTVLTVDPSDNSITFGTPVSLTGTRYKPNIVSNESASNFVLTNNKNDNQSEAHLISVSGTTPTVEDSEDLSAVVAFSYPATGLVFLENNKFLSVYYDQGTENTYARTITVSGSSLSLGTESAAFNTNPGNQTYINGRYPLFFVSTTEAYLYYQDDATDYLRYVPITVSGTTATSGTEITYYSTAVAYEGFGYNSSTKQSLSFFQESSQTKGLAQNGALVIGTDYYVQTDGSLSTDTSGQLIGQAITTTQINIKDYTG